MLVRGRVRRVGELVDVEGAGNLGGEARGDVLVVVGMPLPDIGAGDARLDAERAQVKDLLLAHLVGDDEDQAIALLRRHQREAKAGVARRRLDDRATRLQRAIALGRLDHRESDAVLDRAAGILVLELEEEPTFPGVDPRRYEEGSAADRIEHVLVNWHRWPPLARE